MDSPLSSSALECVALAYPDVLGRLVFFLCPPIGPASDVATLRRASKTLNAALSTDFVMRKMFCGSFDLGAPLRRFSRRWTVTECLAFEYRKRMECLQRMRRAATCQHHSPTLCLSCQSVYANDEILRQDLWTIYLALLEHDERNALQFMVSGQLRQFIMWLLFSQRTMTNGVPQSKLEIELTSLALWALVLTDTVALVRDEHPSARTYLRRILKGIDVSGFAYEPTYASVHSFLIPMDVAESMIPPPSDLVITHFWHTLRPVPPPLGAAAYLASMYRLESDLSLSQLSISPSHAANASLLLNTARWHYSVRARYVQDAPPPPECVANVQALGLSVRHDEDWSRTVSCTNPCVLECTSRDAEDEGEDECAMTMEVIAGTEALRGPVVQLGMLSGTWEGRGTMPDMTDYLAYTTHGEQPGRQAADVRAFMHQITVELQEHHHIEPYSLSDPSRTWLEPGSSALTQDPALGVEFDPQGGHNPRNAYLPGMTEIHHVSGEHAIDMYNPAEGTKSRYWTYKPTGNRTRGNYGNAAVNALLDGALAEAEQEYPEALFDAPRSGRVVDSTPSSGDAVRKEYIHSDEFEDTLHQISSGADDIILTGTTPSTQNGVEFQWIGRVRSWDGAVVLLRLPSVPAYGRYLFIGYVHSRSNFVGRWFLLGAPGQHNVLEGGFSLSKVDPPSPPPVSVSVTPVTSVEQSR